MSSSLTDPDMRTLEDGRLVKMSLAAEKILEIYQLLHDESSNIVLKLLPDPNRIFQWQHYPEGDAFDRQSHSQYYYHAHPPQDRRGILHDEHGHFHLFLRREGIPDGIQPERIPDRGNADDHEAACHLVGISMARTGFPANLFTVNRWVTGETWYRADDVIEMLDCFVFFPEQSGEPVGEWITAMVALFRPTIEALVRARDARIAQMASRKPGANVHEDRSLEILSVANIDMMAHLAALCEELDRRGVKTPLLSIKEEGQSTK